MSDRRERRFTALAFSVLTLLWATSTHSCWGLYGWCYITFCSTVTTAACLVCTCLWWRNPDRCKQPPMPYCYHPRAGGKGTKG